MNLRQSIATEQQKSQKMFLDLNYSHLNQPLKYYNYYTPFQHQKDYSPQSPNHRYANQLDYKVYMAYKNE